MRWGARAAVGLTGLLLGLMVGAAGGQQRTLSLTGALTYSWTGDPARGCAAAGVCGVSGSLEMLATPDIGEVFSSPLSVFLAGPNAAARVTEGGVPSATCADLIPVGISLEQRGRGAQQRVVLNPDNSSQLPSAGRCAGPTANELSTLTLRMRRLGNERYDLSGQLTFGAGPYTVTVTSTLRVGAATQQSQGSSSSSSGSSPVTPIRQTRHTRLQESAELDYQVTGYAGALTASFTALPDPLCDPLGACGSNGQVSLSLKSVSKMLVLSGSRIVRRRLGRGAVLADLKAGRLRVAGSFPDPSVAAVSEAVAQPGGAYCNDSAGTTVDWSPNFAHAAPQLVVTGAQGGGQLQSPDALRTGCPGPSATDIEGNGPLASATVPVADLGAGSFTLTVEHPGSFAGTAYRGTRGGSIVVTLKLVRIRAGTRRVTIYSAPGPFPPCPPGAFCGNFFGR